MRHSLQITLSRMAIAALLLVFINLAQAQSPPPDARSSAQAWTLAEAQARLRLHPEDVYLQYVALQLAHGDAQWSTSPAEASELGRLMREMKDVTATLTFLPEVLRVVVTIERK